METNNEINPIKNQNEALQDRFKLIIRNTRQTTFVCQEANLPSISQSGIRIDNSVNYFTVNSQKLEYEDLSITFKVDEDLNNVKEIHHWLQGITAPQTPDQFSAIDKELNIVGLNHGYTVAVDASLFTLTQVYNANIEIVFVNLMPISFGGLNFNLTADGHMTATATFRYDYYYFK